MGRELILSELSSSPQTSLEVEGVKDFPPKMPRKKVSNPTNKGKKKNVWGYLESIFGYLLLAGGFAYILHGIHLDKLFSQLGGIRWSWVALAIAVNTLSYINWGLSWKWLLLPVAQVSVYDATRAVYAGQFANAMLPARLGELIRAYLISRWVSAEFIMVIPSVIASRLLDGIWSVAGVAVTAFFVRLPKDLLVGGAILAILIAGGTGSLIYFAHRREKVLEGWAQKKGAGGKSLRSLKWFLGHLAMGFRDIGFTRESMLAFLISPLWLLFQALSFWLIIVAYGLDLPLWVGAAVFLIVHFGTILPNAPGDAGVYQFFCVVGLTLFGVDKTSAAGFSLVVYFLLIAPVWLIGFLVLSQSGISTKTIREDIEKFRQQA